MFVSVTRISNRYRRTVNGAWVGDAPESTVTPGVPLERLPHWTIGDSSLTVTFPDGTKEHVLANCQPFPGYPPSVLGPRLQEAFKAAGAPFNSF